MIPNIPTLGVRFDIDKIDSAAYGLECWRVFWSAIDPEDMIGVHLYEGDTVDTNAGKENVFCIGIQSKDQSILDAIRMSLESNIGFDRVASTPAFVEGSHAEAEHMVEAGEVDHGGNLIGESPRARPALGKVRRERGGELAVDVLVEPAPARTPPASPRTESLPELSSIVELKQYLTEKFNPEPEKAWGTLFWITPEEVCDIVDHYAGLVQVYWATNAMPFTEEVVEISLFNKQQQEDLSLLLWGMFSFPSEADAQAYCHDKGRHPDYMIGQLEKLMHVEGKVAFNFTGMASGVSLVSYKEKRGINKSVAPEQLWRMIYNRGRELGLYSAQPVEGKADQEISSYKQWWQFWK
jgi:hypothetical protein